MEKTILMLFVCMAVLLNLTGCQKSRFSSASSENSSLASSLTASVVTGDDSSVSSISSTNSSSESFAKIDADAFDAMMSALEGYEPGTAGASLKLYTAACGVLNFSEGYSKDQEASLRSALEEALAEMPQERLSLLKETFPAVDGAARGIVENGVGSVADILADAGDPNEYTSYDAGKYDSVRAILCDALGVQD